MLRSKPESRWEIRKARDAGSDRDSALGRAVDGDRVLHELERARAGDREVLGRALESCRDYLLLIAARARCRPDRQGRAVGHRAGHAPGGISRLRRIPVAVRATSCSPGSARSFKTILRSTVAATAARVRGRFRSRFRLAARPGQRHSMLCPAIPRRPARPQYAASRSHALLAALERISEDYRRVVVWHQYERLTFEEIGAATRAGRQTRSESSGLGRCSASRKS